MDPALNPLNLAEHTPQKDVPPDSTMNTENLAQYLEEIAQRAASLINADPKKEFLYKNPNGWHLRKPHYQMHQPKQKIKQTRKVSIIIDSSSDSSTSSTTSGEGENQMQPWSLIEDFEFQISVEQIIKFIETWELSPATKFVVIGLNEIENNEPFGKRYFVEANFSKPTNKCPNPLAVAKVHFQINVSHLLPKDYPVNVTYKFEGYKSQFYALGEYKMSSNKFQRYYIDAILHMKLAFYAKLLECQNEMKPLVKRKHQDKFVIFESK